MLAFLFFCLLFGIQYVCECEIDKDFILVNITKNYHLIHVRKLLIFCPYESLNTSSICNTLSEPEYGIIDNEQITLSSGPGPNSGTKQGFMFVLVFLYLQRANDFSRLEK